MVLFIFGLILLVAAGITLVRASGSAAGITRVVASIVLVIGLLMFIFSFVRSVPTRSVGVPTSFGKVEPSIRPGIHFKAPWTSVNIMDETIQTTTFEGKNCLTVRIGGQQTACLDVTIQWRILDSGAAGLFSDYNGSGSFNTSNSVTPSTVVPGGIMGNITDAVVIRELEQVVNEVLGDYNPIQDVSTNTTAGNSEFSTFGPKVLKQMRSDLSGRITVANVLMPLLRYDTATQSRLNQIQQQFGQTAIANQEIQTNEAQAKANAAIKSSVSTQQLQYQCLQIAQDAIKAGDNTVQPGWCFGSSGVIANTGS